MASMAMAEDTAPLPKLLRFGPPPKLRQLFEQSDAVAILVANLSLHRLGRLELTVETLYKEGPEPYNSRHAIEGFATPNDYVGKEYLVFYSGTINQSTKSIRPILFEKGADGVSRRGVWLGDFSAGPNDFVPLQKIDHWFGEWAKDKK